MSKCLKHKNKNEDQGFVVIRRGIYEHLSDGRMTGREWMVYSILHLKADHETGICYKISGPALAHLLKLKHHNINRILRLLEAKGYIKRISHRGQVICYPVVINKFLTSNGILIDAANTKSLKEIAWYVEQDCTLTILQRSFKCTSNVRQLSCLQELKKITIIKRDFKKNGNGAKPRPPKRFTPPALEDVKEYVKANAELGNVDPEYFWKYFNDGEWIDSKGNRVRNWKQKLRTWSNNERKGISKDEPPTQEKTGRSGKGERAQISGQDFGELHNPLE